MAHRYRTSGGSVGYVWQASKDGVAKLKAYVEGEAGERWRSASLTG